MHRKTSRRPLAAVLLERKVVKVKAHLKVKAKVVPRARVSTAGTGLGRVLVVRVRAVLVLEEAHKVATTNKAALISHILKVAVTQHSTLISPGNSSTGSDLVVLQQLFCNFTALIAFPLFILSAWLFTTPFSMISDIIHARAM
jgi:hypothetical protein